MRTGIGNRLPDWLYTIRRYQRTHNAFPNLMRPRNFNEKVLYRMLFDRRAILTQVTDKLAVRSFVETRLGARILPRLIYVTASPDTIPFEDLPGRFVIKATHGSGWVKVVTDRDSLDRQAVVKLSKSWLKRNYYEVGREWAYKHIEPRTLIEEFIEDGSRSTPNDYKCFVFDGRVEMIQVDVDRFTGHRRRLYTPSWKKLDVLFGYPDIDAELAPPPHLAEMISAAETLGQDLDFIRADFYDTAERLFFGELTTTPECGLVSFVPSQFGEYLGERWRMPTWRSRGLAPWKGAYLRAIAARTFRVRDSQFSAEDPHASFAPRPFTRVGRDRTKDRAPGPWIGSSPF